MKLSIRTCSGQSKGEYTVGFDLVKGVRGIQAVHDTVVAHLANKRSGTASSKTVGDVSGSNKKPWRQKGTGRARAGSFQSPLWVGGGVVFGPKPRDFRKKVNKKTRCISLARALSERILAGEVVLIEDGIVDQPKTKQIIELLERNKLSGTILIVVDKVDRNVILASRNVPLVDVVTSEDVNTYRVLRPDKLLFTLTAFEKLERRLRD